MFFPPMDNVKSEIPLYSNMPKLTTTFYELFEPLDNQVNPKNCSLRYNDENFHRNLPLSHSNIENLAKSGFSHTKNAIHIAAPEKPSPLFFFLLD